MRIGWMILLIGLGSLALLPAARGQEATGPTTHQAIDPIQQWIARLGDPDFHVRREASLRLRELGAAALPALKEAAESGSLEVRDRAKQLVALLERPRLPGPRGGIVGGSSFSVAFANGQRRIDVQDRGREIHIDEGADGIEMTVAGELDGRPAHQTYKAASVDELRSRDPDAFALYERWTTQAGTDWALDGIANAGRFGGNVMVFRQQLPVPIVAGGDDLVGLRIRVTRDMDKAQLTPDQRQQVHRALDRVEQTRRLNAAAGLANPDQEIDRYERACDELRKVLADLKLPDPGDVLPPPSSSRLGISVVAEPGNAGIVVSHVLPKSRADRMGLQSDDVVRKVNDKDIRTVGDLRRLVTDNPKGLVLDITRDGQEMKLTEK